MLLNNILGFYTFQKGHLTKVFKKTEIYEYLLMHSLSYFKIDGHAK